MRGWRAQLQRRTDAPLKPAANLPPATIAVPVEELPIPPHLKPVHPRLPRYHLRYKVAPDVEFILGVDGVD